MNVEMITREDLERFKEELFGMIKELTGKPQFGEQKWLKSYQVKNLLKISNGTLQNLRVNGTLAYSKIGGIIYYKYEDIVKVLEGQKNKNPFAPHPLSK
ncbi:helix-turn-helix domain-containing protein [Mucilaginibacter achroorhodeus]|uniref:Helix-turn-helix domain-containing protein n=2 Tax=Mucilaginibacter achroorhodeus TaxID=2599294 RepID=A0A563U023_9SPHI|nr:helix-turn-helix domain-containing protein [Mucilaginibacter achroorhodeus]